MEPEKPGFMPPVCMQRVFIALRQSARAYSSRPSCYTSTPSDRARYTAHVILSRHFVAPSVSPNGWLHGPLETLRQLHETVIKEEK